MKLTIFEQYSILNNQIENIYSLISNSHKFFSVLCSSVGGISILLYSNKIEPSNEFNYMYYTLLILFALAIIWYRTLLIYMYDLNQIADKYDLFIKKNEILTGYQLSYPLNIRRCNIILPLALAIVILAIFLRYLDYKSITGYVWMIFYLVWFYWGFIRKIDLRIFKYL